MNTRALLVVGAFVAMPAWSQEPAAEGPPQVPAIFDLSRVGWVECQASIDLKRETLGNGSCNR